jgi:phenylacetate-coenzyme A ligase PaaK-like adenylate-forming protein
VFPILRARQKQLAGTLSGGEQQMLAIGRGLMSRPKLLLLDEPCLGLAPLLVQEILHIIAVLRDMGRTVLLVEQNASGALQIADRAYLIEVGRIVLHGTAQELFQDERVRRAYMGKRIAPVRRPHKVKSQPNHNQVRDTRPDRTRRETRQESYPMKTKTLATAVHSHTLPDEYFEERLSYTVDELEAIQDEALPLAFAHAFDNSQFYHDKFSAVGLTPDSVGGLEALSRLPFTTVDEIRPDPARGRTASQIAAVDQQQASVIHTSSGTTGSPKIFPYTGQDVAQWAANVATVMWINGLRKSDTMLEIIPFGQFTGGGGVYVGGIALGLTLIPLSIGPGLTEKVIAHLNGRIRVGEQDVPIDPSLRANSILCLASFLPRLLEMMDEYGVRPEDTSLTKIVCGAEPSSDAVRTRVAERIGVWPRDLYGLGEFYGPGQAGECRSGGGLHFLSDTYIAEVIDPETGEPTPEGEMGELVMTSLHKEAFPLFRYRTGDRVMALPQLSLIHI